MPYFYFREHSQLAGMFWTLKIIFAYLLFALTPHSIANAQPNPTDAPSLIKIYAQQPTRGFREALHLLDQETGEIDHSDIWFTVADADIWVFFLKDTADVGGMPPSAGRVFQSLETTSAVNVVQIDRMTTNGPESSAFIYLVLSEFNDFTQEQISCRASVDILIALGLLEQAREGESMAACVAHFS